jgi:hypothetical protein
MFCVHFGASMCVSGLKKELGLKKRQKLVRLGFKGDDTRFLFCVRFGASVCVCIRSEERAWLEEEAKTRSD